MADGHSNNTSSGSNVPSTTGAPASICLDVFHKFHERLCNITDVDYVVLMSVNKSIIIVFQYLEINRISSGLEKMKILLENVALPLENHRTDQFYKLLDILGESGIESTKSLANSMRREISNYLLHLSGKPELLDLNNHVRPKVAQWRDLGAQLISDDKLKIIEYDKGKHAEACCSQMFQVWLQVDVTASWVKLVKALREPSIAHNALADEIEVKFTGISSTPHLETTSSSEYCFKTESGSEDTDTSDSDDE